jgi:hypothetical protein
MHDWLKTCPALALACGLPLLFLLSPANVHDAPFARPLLQRAVHLYHLRPWIIRLEAGYWGMQLIHWIHAVLGAVAIVPWNPRRQKNRSCLPPTRTAQELGKRTAIERFFGRVFLIFSPATSSALRMVSHRYSRRFDLHRLHPCRVGCSAGRPS